MTFEAEDFFRENFPRILSISPHFAAEKANDKLKQWPVIYLHKIGDIWCGSEICCEQATHYARLAFIEEIP